MWLLRLHEIIISPTTIWLLFPAIDSPIPQPPSSPSPTSSYMIFHGNYIRDRLFYTAHLSSCLIGLPASASASAIEISIAIAMPMSIAIVVVAVALLRLPSLHMRRDLAANYPCNTYANLRTCNSEACRYTHSTLTTHSQPTHSHTHCHTCSCCVHGNQLRLNKSNKTWRVWDVAMKYVIRVIY